MNCLKLAALSALLFSVLASATENQTETQTEPCEVALVSALPSAISLPAIVPTERAPVVATTMLEALQEKVGSAGSLEAVQTLETVITPTLEAVANFLQTRANYPRIFDRDEIAESATNIYDQLSSSLSRLQDLQSREGTRPWWLFWRPAQSQNVTTAIRQVRVFHHGLKAITQSVKENTVNIQRVLDTSMGLRQALLQTIDLAKRIQALLEQSAVAAELRPALEQNVLRRLITLSNDLIAQLTLLDGLVASLDQRVQLNTIMQDRIRSLLTVTLPMVAMIGKVELDLSPLEPGQAAEMQAEAAKELPAPNQKLTISPKEGIAIAKSSGSTASFNETLYKYFKSNQGALNADQVVQLRATMNSNYGDHMLSEYAKNCAETLAASDIRYLAAHCSTNDKRNEILWTYAKYMKDRLTPKDLKLLADSATNNNYRKGIIDLIKM